MNFFSIQLGSAAVTLLVIIQNGGLTYATGTACKGSCGGRPLYNSGYAPVQPSAYPPPPPAKPVLPIAPVKPQLPIAHPVPPYPSLPNAPVAAPSHKGPGLYPSPNTSQKASEKVDIEGFGNILKKIFDFDFNIDAPIRIL